MDFEKEIGDILTKYNLIYVKIEEYDSLEKIYNLWNQNIIFEPKQVVNYYI
jgi:hypothetical protein